MDIISNSQETALQRLLDIDVSDLIEDEDMKKEIKFFRDLKLKEENNDAFYKQEHHDETAELCQKLRAAKKRKADNFQFLGDALEYVKRLKEQCASSVQEVTDFERQLQLAVMPIHQKCSVKKNEDQKPSTGSVAEITESLSAATVSTKEDSDGVTHVLDTTTSRVLESSEHLLCSKKHHDPKFKCALCGIQYFDKRNIHEKYGHLKAKIFQCDTCEKFYTSPPLLRVHQNVFGHSGIRYK